MVAHYRPGRRQVLDLVRLPLPGAVGGPVLRVRTSCEDTWAKPGTAIDERATLRTGQSTTRQVQWQAEATFPTPNSVPVSGNCSARFTSLEGSRLVLDFGDYPHKLISG